MDPASPTDSPVEVSFEDQKNALKKEHAEYVEKHPELQQLLGDFLGQVLLEKPNHIQQFAAKYFSPYLTKSSLVSPPLVVCGPSGVGKGTLCKKLFEEFGDHFGFSVSHTTRAPREGEENGVAYHFTDIETMQRQVDNGEFIESATVHGNMYGTSAAAVRAVGEQGRICVLDIDVQGVKAVKASGLEPNTVYISPPSAEALEERLNSRGTETPESLAERLSNAKEEMEWLETPGNVDTTVVNDDLERAYGELKELVTKLYPEQLKE